MSIGWHWSKCNLPEKPNSRSHALRRVPVLQNARASLKATSISVCLDFSVSLGKSFCSSTMCIHFECNLDHIGNWTLQSTLIVFSQLGNVCTYLLLEFGHALVQIPEKPKFSIAILPRGTLVLIFVPGSHF